MKNKFLLLFSLFFFAACINAGTVLLTNFPPQGPFIDTLRLKTMNVKGEFFFSDADKREIKPLADDNLELSYRVWMQEKPAPLVVVIPGIGGHCAGETQTALAELIYNSGFSVAMLTSPFNWDFLLNASTAVTPGYTPYDAADAYNVIKFVFSDLYKEYGTNLITDKILVGYSLGALESIFIAKYDSIKKELGFERYVALSPPVNLLYAMKQLDSLYSVWTNWSDAEILTNTVKITKYYKKFLGRGLLPTELLKLSDIDAKYTIGIAYRRVLSETLKALLSVKNYAFIKNPYGFKKNKLDKELERYSYFNYLKTFFKTEHPELFTNNFTLRTLNAHASLPALQSFILSSTNIYVFESANDFLLSDYDIKWLSEVFKNHITFFDRGGHLGYFCNSIFQTNFIRALNGLPIKNDISELMPVRAEITNVTFTLKLVSRETTSNSPVTNITEFLVNNVNVNIDEHGTNNTIDLPPASTAAIIRVTIEPHTKDESQKKKTSEQDGIILETIDD